MAIYTIYANKELKVGDRVGVYSRFRGIDKTLSRSGVVTIREIHPEVPTIGKGEFVEATPGAVALHVSLDLLKRVSPDFIIEGESNFKAKDVSF